jgi:hypothetical protein
MLHKLGSRLTVELARGIYVRSGNSVVLFRAPVSDRILSVWKFACAVQNIRLAIKKRNRAGFESQLRGLRGRLDEGFCPPAEQGVLARNLIA